MAYHNRREKVKVEYFIYDGEGLIAKLEQASGIGLTRGFSIPGQMAKAILPYGEILDRKTDDMTLISL